MDNQAATARSLNADERIKLTIGSQFVDMQIQVDQIELLQAQIAERDRTIKALNKTIADLNSEAMAAQPAPPIV